MNHWSLEAVSARKSPDIRRPCKRERVGRNGKARNRRKEEMEAGMSKRENGSWIVGSKEGEMRRMHVAAMGDEIKLIFFFQCFCLYAWGP